MMCKRTDEGLARGRMVSGLGTRAVIRRRLRAPPVMQQMSRPFKSLVNRH
jgi:hypothetical protein